MISRTITGIADIPTRTVNPAYLDARYLDIYLIRYGAGPTCKPEYFLNIVELFTLDLCQYLRAYGIDIREITIQVGTLIGVTLDMYVDDMYYTRVKLLQHQTCPVWSRYDVIAYGRPYYAYHTSSLVMVMKGIFSAYQCSTCHYSNSQVNYCGLGIEMHTGDCHKRKVYDTDIENHNRHSKHTNQGDHCPYAINTHNKQEYDNEEQEGITTG